ncbi:protein DETOXIFICATION 19-like [Silene latifolia]|uniref:protein DETOXIFICATION 19-like n=1 Tax=Silene latifolia TaxID=37657 RepID=UPI003D76F936
MRYDMWLSKVVDVKEAKKQIDFAMPMVLTNVSNYMFPLVAVMYVGHLGELQLAASTLANSWAGVTGFAFMTGLSVALETLCGQAYGAKNYKMLGIYLQTSCIISTIFSILISIMWWYTEHILVNFLHQNPQVSKEASIYMRHLIPGIFAFGIFQNMMRFLQTQSVVWPLVICSTIPLLGHIGLVYVLVRLTPLGFRGAPIAISVSLWISVAMIMVYVSTSKKLKGTWRGMSKECFGFVFVNLKLALSSAAMVCLEYWAFEFLILAAGLLPNSETSTSIVAMSIGTQSISYSITYGLSAATSTRVSNELGAMRPDLAKHAMGVTMKLSIALTAIILLALGFGHEKWASLFSDNINIINSFSSMTPLMCISISLDSIQGVLSGVSRGSGWQNLTTFINLSSYIGICIPVACLLAFKLQYHAKGLWVGLICGIGSQTLALFLVTYFKKWSALELHDNDTLIPNSIELERLRFVNVDEEQTIEKLPLL